MPLDRKLSRSASGLNLESQNETLTDMIELSKGMKIVGGKGFYLFQKELIYFLNHYETIENG